jgi:F0F1-type ATP synthase alpha subunit
MHIPLSKMFLGRVIDLLGKQVYACKVIHCKYKRSVDTKAFGIIPRQSVCESMHTGITVADSPSGLGQRELIIGDRKTGKTTIALDTILSQRKYSRCLCFYRPKKVFCGSNCKYIT